MLILRTDSGAHFGANYQHHKAINASDTAKKRKNGEKSIFVDIVVVINIKIQNEHMENTHSMHFVIRVKHVMQYGRHKRPNSIESPRELSQSPLRYDVVYIDGIFLNL
jgi:hypothetical protein